MLVLQSMYPQWKQEIESQHPEGITLSFET